MDQEEIKETEVIMLCTTRFFSVEKDIDFEIDPFTFSDNIEMLRTNILDDGITKFFGESTLGKPFTQSFYGFCISTFTNTSVDRTMLEEFFRYAVSTFNSLNGFFSKLWFIKDCSAHLNEFIAYFPLLQKGFSIPNSQTLTSSDGSNHEVLFSSEELYRVRVINDKFREIDATNPKKDEVYLPDTIADVLPAQFNITPYNKSSILERAMVFIDFARKSAFIPLKITMYMPVFELFFSNNSQEEISHKISHRCAIYLGGTKEDKKKNYKIIRTAYAIRSNYLHGSSLKSDDLQKNILLCQQIDSIVRIFFTKIVLFDSDIFIKNRADLDNYFADKLFD